MPRYRYIRRKAALFMLWTAPANAFRYTVKLMNTDLKLCSPIVINAYTVRYMYTIMSSHVNLPADYTQSRNSLAHFPHDLIFFGKLARASGRVVASPRRISTTLDGYLCEGERILWNIQ